MIFKKKIYCLIVALSLTAMMGVNAQIDLTYGPKAGLNMTTLTGDIENTGLKAGAQIGGMANLYVLNRLAIQPNLLFSMKGYRYMDKVGGVKVIETLSLNYLELPVNIIYEFNMQKESEKLQLFAGPYISYGLFGKYKINKKGNKLELDDFGAYPASGEADIEFVNDAKDTDVTKHLPINAIDYGINIGIGYTIGQYQIQAAYGLGLGNITPKFNGEFPKDKINNTTFQFSLGYFLD